MSSEATKPAKLVPIPMTLWDDNCIRQRINAETTNKIPHTNNVLRQAIATSMLQKG